MQCACGTQFHLEPYHTRIDGCETMCHRCYADLLPPFTAVTMLNDLTGFNPPTLNLAEAHKGDVAMVMHYSPEKQAYALAASGFIFWAKPDDVRPAHQSALRHVKEYAAITPGTYILKKTQEDIKNYLDNEH